MTYEVGRWFFQLMNVAILAIVVAIGFGVAFWKKNHYAKQVQGCILAEVKQPTGWSKFYVARISPDGKWVRLGRGDYRMATGKIDNPKKPEEMSSEELAEKHLYKVPPSIKEFTMFPQRPFMGLRWLQVPIRKQEWFQDDPEPITWPENRIQVTSIDIQARTREMEEVQEGIETQESEARQRELVKALENQPNKMYVYLLLAAANLGWVILLINYFASRGG